ncbi:NUDIX domain-containing protein [Streptomonospora nanhaiensis]|uniref:NUDIX domain-containing protein n=1 Tax=Streptomonospora nanhaiensis TaxID=1323731 RepID=UPI001C38D2D7|nr:NUDIX domain-containing protein [Streptomonospora nanhaiensis]MBV2364232.1 NUDIX domain-containing protein [Streptomonospora nanhaiensis]
MARACCGTSVGVLITDPRGRLLMIQRGWWPIGVAPVAGHVRDEHDDPAAAVVAETAEEVGLTVVGDPALLWEGRLPNLCASLPADPPGHYWWLYRATATGTVRPAEGETKGAAWYTPDQVRALAGKTVAYARSGGTADGQPADSLEAVWVELLTRSGDLSPTVYDLADVEWLYTSAPPEYWLGGRPKSGRR